jgi:PTS system ascorbate-specific IIB component
MLKVLVACGNGMGTSMLIKMKAETVFKKVGLDATFDHAAVGEASSIAGSYDIVFCPNNLKSQFDGFKNSSVNVIGMKNILSEDEMIEKLREHNYIK